MPPGSWSGAVRCARESSVGVASRPLPPSEASPSAALLSESLVGAIGLTVAMRAIGGRLGRGIHAAATSTAISMTVPSPIQNGPIPAGIFIRRSRKYSRSPPRLDSINSDSAAPAYAAMNRWPLRATSESPFNRTRWPTAKMAITGMDV